MKMFLKSPFQAVLALCNGASKCCLMCCNVSARAASCYIKLRNTLHHAEKQTSDRGKIWTVKLHSHNAKRLTGPGGGHAKSRSWNRRRVGDSRLIQSDLKKTRGVTTQDWSNAWLSWEKAYPNEMWSNWGKQSTQNVITVPNKMKFRTKSCVFGKECWFGEGTWCNMKLHVLTRCNT